MLPYVISLTTVVPLLLTPFPPIQDLPAIAASFQGIITPGDIWEVGDPLCHSWLFYLAGAGLSKLVGPWSAGVMLLGLAAIAFPLSCVALARARGSDPIFTAIAATPLSWNTPFVMGFLPFQLSISLAIAAISVTLRRKTMPGAVVTAIIFSLLVYELHLLGLVALGIGLMAMERRWRAALALAPFILFSLFSFTGKEGTIEVVQSEALFIERFAYLLLSLGPSSVLTIFDVLNPLVLVIAFLLYLRSHPYKQPLTYIFITYLILASFLPDLIRNPPVIMPVSRYLSFFAALIIASVNPQPMRILVLIGAFTLVSLAHATIVFKVEGDRLLPQAQAICELPENQVVFAAPLHRRHSQSWLTTYSHIHLPFMYQVCGRGHTLAAFALKNAPVHLREGPDLAVKYGPLSATVHYDIVISDDADVREYAGVTGLDTLRPCPFTLPWPWVCRLKP